MQKLVTFLMFDGRAEEAMNFYVSLFKDSRIDAIYRYDASGPGKPGSVIHARFTLNGQPFMAMDTAVKHEFTFTPSVSIWVNCDTEAEIDSLYNKMTDGGGVLMALQKYPFSEKYAWISDKFGVSWQLNLTRGA